MTAPLWREHPYRSASVQLGAAAQTGGRVRKLRIEYTHLSRSVYLSQSLRHEVGLFTQYRSVFAEARGRILRGEGLPSGTVGGRLAGGVRVHTAGAGQWEVRATWDSYDLSLASRQFVTLRVDQRLPFHRGELALHLRWRSAYASQAAVLSLRVDSSVYL